MFLHNSLLKHCHKFLSYASYEIYTVGGKQIHGASAENALQMAAKTAVTKMSSATEVFIGGVAGGGGFVYT